MQMVIDIPEETVNEIKDNAMFAGAIPSEILWDVTSAITNGTPLPKGHGRLIDADKELAGLKEMKVMDEADKQSVRFAILEFEHAKPIIEADKAESGK